jgi:aspartate-semialdehyde dehydrogenase
MSRQPSLILRQLAGMGEGRAINYVLVPLDTTGKDDCLVGRIRKNIVLENALDLWVVGDQVRKGAALNAVQIAEIL